MGHRLSLNFWLVAYVAPSSLRCDGSRQVCTPFRSVLNVRHWRTAPPSVDASVSVWLVAYVDIIPVFWEDFNMDGEFCRMSVRENAQDTVNENTSLIIAAQNIKPRK